MSTYLETSFISTLNATPIGYWIDASSSFLQVMNMAIEICKLSEGYFDVSAGGLVNMWGFGPSEILNSPDQSTVLNSLKEIGCDSISIDTLNNRVRRERNVQIDFSAIAKGFAIDQVYNELKKNIYITTHLHEQILTRTSQKKPHHIETRFSKQSKISNKNIKQSKR